MMDIPLRLFTSSILVVFYLVRCLKMAATFWRRSRRVPRITNDLLNISATQLAHKIRNKEVTSSELVSAYISRIKEVNPIINAIVEDRFEQALLDAKEVDELLASGTLSESALQSSKPLLGIPVTIKENLSVKGLSSTLCSNIHRGEKAKEDGGAVKLLKDAGAIPILVSTTPEYCICMETYSKVFGISRNPYNHLRVVGGSSGGEGALLGAGASVIGIGSDLAGSIRFPSAFNGIFGHKPTHGFIPLDGILPDSDDPNFVKCLTLGPMTRFAEDLPLMMKILTNNSKQLRLDEKVNLNKIRIYFMEDCSKNFGLMGVQREIKEKIRECASYFETTHRSYVSGTKFENMGYAQEICCVTSAKIDYATPLRTEAGNFSSFFQLPINAFGLSRFCEYIMVQDIVDKITKMSPPRIIKRYNDKLDELKDKMTRELGRDGVFFFPAYPTTAPRHKEFMLAYCGVFYAFIINILGFPSTTVPVGLDSNGLPIGIQVVANVNEDRLCMAVAEELGKAFGGWREPSV